MGGFGCAYLALGGSAKSAASENRQRTSSAREMFRQALKVIDDSRRRHGPLGSNEEWAKEIADEIAKCDAALGR